MASRATRGRAATRRGEQAPVELEEARAEFAAPDQCNRTLHALRSLARPTWIHRSGADQRRGVASPE